MFEVLTPLMLIFYQTAIALGVGSSTLAVASFMVALSDNELEKSERRMLGVIYTMLRVAMVSILFSLTYLSLVVPSFFPSLIFIWWLMAVLYLNAIFMTKHWMPIQVGPAIQGATWYTLGFVSAINVFGLYEVSATFFAFLYATDFLIALALLNGLLFYFKNRK